MGDVVKLNCVIRTDMGGRLPYDLTYVDAIGDDTRIKTWLIAPSISLNIGDHIDASSILDCKHNVPVSIQLIEVVGRFISNYVSDKDFLGAISLLSSYVCRTLRLHNIKWNDGPLHIHIRDNYRGGVLVFAKTYKSGEYLPIINISLDHLEGYGFLRNIISYLNDVERVEPKVIDIFVLGGTLLKLLCV